MFVISITLAPGHAQAVLHFKTEDSMREGRMAIMQARAAAGAVYCTVRDDYSRVLDVALKDILAVCASEVETSKESEIDAALLQQQANGRLNLKWMKDPLFKSVGQLAQLMGIGGMGRAQ